jgi:O-antigen/teichoic acid export membrane protein
VTLRALVRGSVIYTLGSVIPRLGIFLLLPVYTLGMGPGEFGVFSLMLSLAGLLTIFFRLGLDGSLLRFHFDVATARLPALYWTTAALTAAAGVGLGLAALVFLRPVFEAAFAGIAFFPYGALAIAIGALTAFQYVPTSWFRATERPELVFWLGIGSFAAGAVVTLWLVLALHLGAVGGLIGQLAIGAAFVAVAGTVLLRLRPAALDPVIARQDLAFGLPLIPHSIAGWVLNLSDRWLIGLLIGLSAAAAQIAVGIYSLGYQLAQLVSLIGVALNTAWIPFFYEHGEQPEGPAILREMSSLSVGALSIVTVMAGVLAPEAIAVLAPASWGPDKALAATVVPIVAFAALIQGLYFMVSSPIFLHRRTRGLPLLTISAGAVNVGLNLILIPRLGIIGAAWSTIAGYLTMLVLSIWFAGRTFDLRIDWPRMATLFGASGGAMYAAHLLQPAGLVASGLLHMAIGVAFVILVLALLRRPWSAARVLIRTNNAQRTVVAAE